MAHHSMDGCEDDRSGARGFSILELVVVLAVLTADLAGASALAITPERRSNTVAPSGKPIIAVPLTSTG